jgi:hypothetical protein
MLAEEEEREGEIKKEEKRAERRDAELIEKRGNSQRR